MKRNLHLVVLLAIIIIFNILPPFPGITETGMKVLGVFVSLLYGWIFFDLFWTSIFGFVMLGVLGLTTITEAFVTGIANQQSAIMMGGMLIACALQELEITDYIAYKLLKIKVLRKKPLLLVGSFMLVAYILSALGATLAGIFILWAILDSLIKNCDINKDSIAVSFITFMIVVAGFEGNGFMPFNMGAILYGGYLTNAVGLTTGYAPYMIIVAATTLIPISLMLLVAKFILRIDFSKFILSDEIIGQFAVTKMSVKQKYSLIILICYISALLLPELFKGLPGMSTLGSYGILGVTFITLLVMAVITVNGEPLIKLEKVFSNGILWTIIVVVSVVFPLVEIMNTPETGIMVTVMGLLTPIVEGLGIYTFMVVTMVIVGLLSQFTHNIVVGAVLIPVFCPMVLNMAGEAATLSTYFMYYTALNCAFATPAACAGAALAFSAPNIKVKYASLIGWTFFAINMVVTPLICIPLGNILY